MDTFTIGRADADVVLDDPEKTVSKHHAELTIGEGGRSFYLVDCGSSNGTFVHRDGRWVKIKQDTIKEDDLVRFGSSNVRIRDLLKRLPKRRPQETVMVEPPENKTVLQAFRNAETGEVEYR
jgi:pSer/pThr/pTyr-binding forkhead associated (FHA) protein